MASTAAGYAHAIWRNPGDRYKNHYASSSRTNEGTNDSTHYRVPDRGPDCVANHSLAHRDHHGRNPHTERYAVHVSRHRPNANAHLMLSLRQVVHPPTLGAASRALTTA